MRALSSLAIVAFLSLQSFAAEPPATVPSPPAQPAQPGVGERVGETVERGLTNLGQKIRKTWADFRRSVDELSVQGRVYARLHWDKALAAAPIEISVQNENVVVLSGAVPTEAARHTAVTLADGTVGVGRVVDRMTVGTTTTTTTTTTTLPTTLPPTVPQK
jgi:hyperosmotically inducible protein